MGDYRDFSLKQFADWARESSGEVAGIDDVLMDYERGWRVYTGDKETNLFLASAREIVLELVRRVQQLEREP